MCQLYSLEVAGVDEHFWGPPEGSRIKHLEGVVYHDVEVIEMEPDNLNL